jgi:hypothetical protein
VCLRAWVRAREFKRMYVRVVACAFVGAVAWFVCGHSCRFAWKYLALCGCLPGRNACVCARARAQPVAHGYRSGTPERPDSDADADTEAVSPGVCACEFGRVCAYFLFVCCAWVCV